MTGQYPRRRETDAQAQHRNERAEALRRERQEMAYPVSEAVWKAWLPRISRSGRLTRGGS